MMPYPAYKDSGLQWLGPIPEHWEHSRAKWIFQEFSEKNHPDEPLLSATQDKGVFPRDLLENRVMMPMGELAGFKFVLPGDFVISLRSFEGGIEYSAYKGLISPAYTVLRRRCPIVDGYFVYLLKSFDYIQELNTAVTGIRDGQSIRYKDFGELCIPTPPTTEQFAIVAFLNRKCADIDRFLDRKRRLIALLKEQKAAIITQAVTRGLNPDAPRKPSGVEWLGDVPEHWTMTPLKHLVRCLDGKRVPLSGTERELITGKIPYWGANNIVDYINDWLFDEELVLLGEDGAPFFDAYRPVAFYTNEKVWINNHIHVLQPTSKIDGSTRDKLTQGNMNVIPIQLPPLDEQKAIVKHIETESAKIDAAIGRTEREMELMHEYRTALISEAVTGKIDVRESAGQTAADGATGGGASASQHAVQKEAA